MKQTIYILIFMFFLQACDGPYDNCPEYHFSDEFKANVIFNQGSYWVYKDTVLDLIDSVHINFQNFYFDEICKPSSRPTDVLTQMLYSSFSSNNNDTVEFYLMCRASWSSIYYSDWDNFGYFNGNLVSDEYYQYSTLDSILINGIWYHDIKIFSNENNRFYWSRKIGLIRKEFKSEISDTTYHFDLIKYHLNQ